MSETRRLPPHGQGTVLGTSENCGCCALLDCACIVRASWLLPAAGARGMKGNGRSQEANFPLHRESTRGTTASEAAQKGGADGKGAAPPPPHGQVPRQVLASCPQRARPGGKGNKPDTIASKHDGYRVVMECACNVRATCLPPEAGTQGTKGTEGSHTATPRPPQSENERNRSGAAKKGRANRKGVCPPPTGKCRATCLHRARNVHAPEERTTRAPPQSPPPQEGDEGTEGKEKRGTSKGGGGGTRANTGPEGETGGKR